MITEVFGKEMISTPNSPWNYGTGVKPQIGYGTCDQRLRDTEQIQDVSGLNGLPALPSALRVDRSGLVASGARAVAGVSRIIAGEQPGFAGKPSDRAPHRARFDNLTTLHSRIAMREKLANCARDAEAIGQSTALILLDLDDFNDVNDIYGQAAGDACLRNVASRLIATVGALGFLARIGEDEFALLLQGHTRRSLSRIVKDIQDALVLPFSFDEHMFHLTASIGIAFRCEGRRFNPDELIRDAH